MEISIKWHLQHFFWIKKLGCESPGIQAINYLADAVTFAQSIRDLSEAKSPLHITINSNKGFTFPWALMYEKDEPLDANPDRGYFWGFGHIIQQPRDIGIRTQRSHSQKIKLDIHETNFCFSYDPDLDSAENTVVKAYQVKCVERQKEFFTRKLASTPYKLIERDDKAKVLTALQADLYDRIIYFYCHAKYGPNEGGSTDDSFIQLTRKRKFGNILELDPDKIKLKELRSAERYGGLMGSPLVFINACESAGMSALFYEGFLPFFIRKGASGVIGTLHKVPQIFSAEFAMRLFDSILPEQEIDDVIQKVRKEFADEPHNNLLGLYYVSCCSPGLSMT